MSLPLFFALYCVEAGVFFIVIPWTRFWTFNAFLHNSAQLATLFENPFTRGFVSGIGLVHLIVGIRDLIRLSRERRGEGTRP